MINHLQDIVQQLLYLMKGVLLDITHISWGFLMKDFLAMLCFKDEWEYRWTTWKKAPLNDSLFGRRLEQSSLAIWKAFLRSTHTRCECVLMPMLLDRYTTVKLSAFIFFLSMSCISGQGGVQIHYSLHWINTACTKRERETIVLIGLDYRDEQRRKKLVIHPEQPWWRERSPRWCPTTAGSTSRPWAWIAASVWRRDPTSWQPYIKSSRLDSTDRNNMKGSFHRGLDQVTCWPNQDLFRPQSTVRWSSRPCQRLRHWWRHRSGEEKARFLYSSLASCAEEAAHHLINETAHRDVFSPPARD